MQTNDKQRDSFIPKWLEWAREIQSLAQTGLHFAENHYQSERFTRLLEIAAEIVSDYSDLEKADLVKIYTNQIGYATPRIDVRGAVFQNGKLLLVRERVDGGWTMPGGWADVGDLPSEAVEREVLEESGFQVTVEKVIGVYDANRTEPLEVFHAFKIVFLCNIIGGESRISSETSQVGFFSQDDIPEVLSGERTKIRHIDDAFRANSLNGSTIFD